jgi:anthranilate synthase/aminodeoxychorismate synthase-like glutamine amidotransferase
MKVLIIDNYDSFTFNLYQYCGELLSRKERNFVLDVFRNDKITLEKIKQEKYDRIIISPGPGDPGIQQYFGICSNVISQIGKATPLLGVCLGMQGIASVFGSVIIHGKKPVHGKTSAIVHDNKGVFTSLPQDLEVMRYHSLIVAKDSLPKSLAITAITKDTGEIMGIRHKSYPIEGIQFHPESFATEAGKRMLENFLFQSYE